MDGKVIDVLKMKYKALFIRQEVDKPGGKITLQHLRSKCSENVSGELKFKTANSSYFKKNEDLSSQWPIFLKSS